MRVAPDIAALRKDRAPQLRAQAAMFAAREAWQSEAGVAQVLAETSKSSDGERRSPPASRWPNCS